MYKRLIDKNKEQIGEKRINIQAHKRRLIFVSTLELM